MYACICREITEADVRHVGRRGIVTPKELIAVLGLEDHSCCGRCVEHVEQFIQLATEGASAAVPRGSSDRNQRKKVVPAFA
jgi:bacterioferritin-associated ferredoxin